MSERSPLLRASSHSDHSTLNDDDDVLPDDPTKRLSTSRAAFITFSLSIQIFLFTCNTSVFTVLQSAIAVDLEATTETSWFISAFLIASASVTPVAGKLCQVFGSRAYLLCSTIVSAIGLLVTALAPKLSIFLGGRALYGMGVAALAPVALILVTEYASKRRRGLLFGLINCAYTVGVACGAVIGGALEPVIGWRACFWIQVPLILGLAVCAFFSIPKSSGTSKEIYDVEPTTFDKLSRIDYFGIITMVGAVVLFLYSFSAPRLEVTPIILSLIMLALFIFVETSWAEDPIIPPAVLRSRGCLFTGLATIGTMAARWAVLFYVPTYAIAVRGWSQERAGLLLIPTNAGFGLGGVIVGLVHIKQNASYYLPSLVCFVLFAATHFIIAALSVTNSSIWALISVLVINGLLIGSLLNYTLAHLLYVTEARHHFIVLPVLTMFRILAGAFGSSISGGVFIRALQKSLKDGFKQAGLPHNPELIRQLLGRPMLVQELSGTEKSIAISSYSASLQQLYVTGGILVLAMLVLQSGTGWTAPTEVEIKRIEHETTSLEEEAPSSRPVVG